MSENYMILNGKNIGISKMTIDKDDLIIVDKSKKYEFVVTISYNLKDISQLKKGEKTPIEFNEYIFSENNESSLIWPTTSYVEKNTNQLIFYFEFKDMSNIQYMNKKGKFDITPESLIVKYTYNY